MTTATNQPNLEGFSCPAPQNQYEEVLMAHGGGGRLTQDLIQRIFLPEFQNNILKPLHDGAIFSVRGTRFAFSTDSYVVHPVFFPGGDIGSLAVHGTINDLAMCGATPLYISVAVILEEGFSLDALRRIAASIGEAARNAGVLVVTGDTKVVDRGKGDQIFINTSGIGIVAQGSNISPQRARAGDKIIASGQLGMHGIAIMSVREDVGFTSGVRSDSAPLHGLVADLLREDPTLHVLRDPTRGGVASALNEIAQAARLGISLDEDKIPVSEEVLSACEILGFDPLYLANEGRLLALVAPAHAVGVLRKMQNHPLGRDAAIIGEVVSDHPGLVVLKTRIGGERIVDMPSGEQLPEDLLMRPPAVPEAVQPHLFGPLRSRRLGMSLGVDVIPRKVCSLDCVYCEVGRTTRYAVTPEPHYGVAEVASEIEAALALRPDIEWITFSGSGEPTLNSRLGGMIREVRRRTSTPVAVITNGTLLWIEEVRRMLMEADAVLPSLDAATQAAFQRINQPDPLLDVSIVIEGLKSFRTEYRGKIFLEILLVQGVNDGDDEILALKKAVGEIRPDKVHLNTVVRPPAESWAAPLDARRMREIAGIIGCGCEIIADVGAAAERSPLELAPEAVLQLLARRPMKAAELRDSFHVTEEALRPLLDRLVAEGSVVHRLFAHEEFFALRTGA